MKDKEWKQLGIKPKLGREFQTVMDGLWIIAQHEFKNEAKNIENSIRIANWKIFANFINNEYINVIVQYKDEDRLEIRHTNENLPSILTSVFHVVKNTYKNPLR